MSRASITARSRTITLQTDQLQLAYLQILPIAFDFRWRQPSQANDTFRFFEGGSASASVRDPSAGKSGRRGRIICFKLEKFQAA